MKNFLWWIFDRNRLRMGGGEHSFTHMCLYVHAESTRDLDTALTMRSTTVSCCPINPAGSTSLCSPQPPLAGTSVSWPCLHIEPLHTTDSSTCSALNCFRNYVFLLNTNYTSIISLINSFCVATSSTQGLLWVSQAAVPSRSPVLSQTIPWILLKWQSSFVCLPLPGTCYIWAQLSIRPDKLQGN